MCVPWRSEDGGRRFQFCIEPFQNVRRLFLQLSNFVILAAPEPEPLVVGGGRVPDLVGSRLPSPYHFRARIQSFQAVAAPFPGDSVLLSRRPPGDRRNFAARRFGVYRNSSRPMARNFV